MQTSWLHNSQQSRSFTQPLLSGVRTDKNLCRCASVPRFAGFSLISLMRVLLLLMKYSLPVLPPARFQTAARGCRFLLLSRCLPVLFTPGVRGTTPT